MAKLYSDIFFCLGLCDVINSPGTSKTLCTRALWCLANQNFSSAQMVDHVKTIVTLVTNVLVSQQQATPTVDTEALNLFVRSGFTIHHQISQWGVFLLPGCATNALRSL